MSLAEAALKTPPWQLEEVRATEMKGVSFLSTAELGLYLPLHSHLTRDLKATWNKQRALILRGSCRGAYA